MTQPPAEPQGQPSPPAEPQATPPAEPQGDPEKAFWDRFKKETSELIDGKLSDFLKNFGKSNPSPSGSNRTSRPQTFPEQLHDIVFGKPKE